MKKQELIEKYEDEFSSIGMNLSTAIRFKKLWIDILELDEPQKVMIPRFIADWIVQAKEDGYNIAGAINEAPRGAVDDWLELENVDIFAEAWVNGYEIEKEKRYLVKIRGFVECGDYFNYFVEAGHWAFSGPSNHPNVRTYHTRKELEEAGLSDVFNSPLFEVEEVE